MKKAGVLVLLVAGAAATQGCVTPLVWSGEKETIRDYEDTGEIRAIAAIEVEGGHAIGVECEPRDCEEPWWAGENSSGENRLTWKVTRVEREKIEDVVDSMRKGWRLEADVRINRDQAGDPIASWVIRSYDIETGEGKEAKGEGLIRHPAHANPGEQLLGPESPASYTIHEYRKEWEPYVVTGFRVLLTPLALVLDAVGGFIYVIAHAKNLDLSAFNR